MSGLLNGLSHAQRGRIVCATQPEWAQPMLATLTQEPFDDASWIYERKLDGVRLLAFRRNGKVTLLTRNRRDRSATWFEIRDALADKEAPDCIVDGEVVTFEDGVSSFRRLQQRMQISDEEEARQRAREIPAYLYVFDLLHWEGFNLTALPLRTRKSLLRKALRFEDPIRFTPHRNGDGVSYLKEACTKGWEGLIAKDARSEYEHSRSKQWLKFKCVNRQEFVIGGFTDPEGHRRGFGSLLIGYYEDSELRYAGRVGTGYDDALLESLRSRLGGLERKTPAFRDDVPGEGVHWVTPKLVCEVAFTEWTEAHRLRHPRFIGLRDDKDAPDVKREKAAR